MTNPTTWTPRALLLAQGVLILGSVAAGLFLYLQVGPLLQQRDRLRAEIAKSAEELKRGRVELAGLEETKRRLQGENARFQAENQRLDADRMVLAKSILNVGAGQSAQDAVEGAVSAVSATTDQTRISPRVYIHVGSRERDDVAKGVADVLQRAGFIVPSIERVTSVPNRPQLRYFRAGDAEDAGRAVAVIGNRIPGLAASLFPGAERSTRIRPRHLELWF